MRLNRRRNLNRDHQSNSGPSAAPEPEAAETEGSALVMQADPYRVQQADHTLCHVTDCPAIAIPEDWEVVDLDTGAELPMRLCEEHQLAYLRH